jgi:bifunctional non-homologous end joining protein LigD
MPSDGARPHAARKVGGGGSLTAGGITVKLSRTGKVLFPGDEITKGDLIGYYAEVAGRMLPHLRDRPLALARYPDGTDGERIFQKNVPAYFPDWVSRAEVAKQDGSLSQVICDKPATLIYLANQACIELHVFLSRVGHLHRLDQVVVDLDPPGPQQFGAARQAALLVRDLLEGELGLTTFVKTTGGKGLHVHLPLDGQSNADEAREFTRDVAELLTARHPDLLTTEQRKDPRGDRVYADIMRNAYAQTVVAAYSVRARPGAPVATPLDWDEVANPGLDPGGFTLRTVPARLDQAGKAGDPWAGLYRHRFSLDRASGKLARLSSGG